MFMWTTDYYWSVCRKPAAASAFGNVLVKMCSWKHLHICSDSLFPSLRRVFPSSVSWHWGEWFCLHPGMCVPAVFFELSTQNNMMHDFLQLRLDTKRLLLFRFSSFCSQKGALLSKAQWCSPHPLASLGFVRKFFHQQQILSPEQRVKGEAGNCSTVCLQSLY